MEEGGVCFCSVWNFSLLFFLFLIFPQKFFFFFLFFALVFARPEKENEKPKEGLEAKEKGPGVVKIAAPFWGGLGLFGVSACGQRHQPRESPALAQALF